MTKREFIKKYAKKNKITFNNAEKEVEIFLETLIYLLKLQKEVSFTKKGKFKIVERNERWIANPLTKEKMKISPPPAVIFRNSLSLIKKN